MPVLENLRPVLHNLDPFLQYTGEYVPEVQAFFANLTAASAAQGKNGSVGNKEGPKQHLLTTMAVLEPGEPRDLPQPRRHGPLQPLPAAGRLQLALERAAGVQHARNCAPTAPSVSGPANETVSESTITLLHEFKVANKPGDAQRSRRAPVQPAGPVQLQRPESQFPHVVYGGK